MGEQKVTGPVSLCTLSLGIYQRHQKIFPSCMESKERSLKALLSNCVPSNKEYKGFPGGTVVKNLPANAGDTGSSPGWGRSHMPRSN